MNLAPYFFALPIGAVPDHLTRVLVARGDHDLLDNFYTQAASTWTAFTEVWLTREARDRALGLYGSHARFVAVEANHSIATGPDLLTIGVGHGVGEPGFDRLARPLVRAHLQTLWQNRAQSIVIKRCRYCFNAPKRQQITVTAIPEFGVLPDDDEIANTAEWLRKASIEWLRPKPTVGDSNNRRGR